MQKERRYLSLYFPHWSTDITQRKIHRIEPLLDSPILLTSEIAQQVVVKRCCRMSEDAGVCEGMALPLAMALSPESYVEQFDPIRDFKSLYKLSVWLLRYSPLVGVDYDLVAAYRKKNLHGTSALHYGIVIDLTGTEGIHGDHQLLTQEIYNLFDHKARIAVAPTIGCAWALSRFGGEFGTSFVASTDLIPSSVQSLPINALRVSVDSIESLSLVGVATVGELLSLPRSMLTKRFGKLLLHRIDQCLGVAEERLHTVETPALYEGSRTFEPPLEHRGSIAFVIKHLFQEVAEKLRLRKKAAKYFQLSIHETGGRILRKDFPLTSATDDPSHLSSILDPIIDGMNFFAEVNKITLRARQIEQSISEQRSFSGEQRDAPMESERNQLINSFSIRLGKHRVSLARTKQSYIPENSFFYQPVLDSSDCGNGVHDSRPVYGIEDRPPVIYTKPEPITTIAMLPDKPPSRITWRKQTLKIISGTGPERIAPEWWQGPLEGDLFAERDYFKIQDEHGRWLWIYREQKSFDWFVHGIWA